jgi:hypothetical protein
VHSSGEAKGATREANASSAQANDAERQAKRAAREAKGAIRRWRKKKPERDNRDCKDIRNTRAMPFPVLGASIKTL